MSYTLAIVLAAASLVLGSCTKADAPLADYSAHVSGDTVQLTSSQQTNARLSFSTAQKRTLTTGLRATGLVHVPPQYAYSITAPFGGIVKTTSVLPGSHVHKGEIVVVLEHQDFITLQQEYLSTAAMLDAAELDLTRQERLAVDSVNARKRLEYASAETRSLRIKKKALSEKLAMINIDSKTLSEKSLSRSVRIPSPINGFVTKVHINAGAYIMPNNPIMEIVDTDHMHIELTIFERDVQKLHVDQHVTVSLTDAPDNKRHAHIHLIGKDIGADRTVSVHAHLNVPDPSLIPGTTLTAVIDAQPRTSWVVAQGAVVSYDGKFYIFTGAPASCVRREVNVGITENGITEILGDPSWLTTEQVLVNGAPAVLGAMVNKEE